MVLMKAFWNWNAPFKGGSRYTQVAKGVALESGNYQVAMMFWTNETWILLNVLEQLLMISAHLEEVGLLLD
jgi:hypothetical protein